MPLVDRIQKDMVEAMKAKEEMRLGAIRMVKAALLKYKADQMKVTIDTLLGVVGVHVEDVWVWDVRPVVGT